MERFWEDDFEGGGPNLGGGVREATAHADTVHGSGPEIGGDDDYFYLTDLTQDTGDGLDADFTGVTGFYWRGEDVASSGATSGAGDPDLGILNYTGIDIFGQSNIVFSGLFGGRSTTANGNFTYEVTDVITVSYQIDGGGFMAGLQFVGTGVAGAALRQDLNLDGVIDAADAGSATLTEALVNFDFAIAGIGSTLDLRIETNVGAAEEIAFDTLALDGEFDDFGDSTRPGTLVLDDGPVNGELEVAGDTDFFAITVEAGDAIQFNLDGVSLNDTFLRLYDTDGTTILTTDDDDGPGFFGQIPFVFETAGTYFLEADEFESNNAGTYTLEAITIPQINVGGAPTLGEIVSGEDRDSFVITLTAGEEVQIDLRGTGSGSGTANNPTLILFDGSNTLIALDLNSGEGLDARLVFTPTETGTYIIEADTNFNGLGTYELSVVQTAPIMMNGTSGDDDFGGSTGDDVLNGLAGDDIIRGFGGDDVINAGEGNDTVNAGDGDDIVTDSQSNTAFADHYIGGDGIDTLVYTNPFGGGNVLDLSAGEFRFLSTANDTFEGFENVSVGNTVGVIGDDGDNVITDLGELDIFTLTVNNNFDGGGGIDTISYENATANLNIDLINGTGTGGIAEGDVLSNIENVIGGTGNDVITGSFAGEANIFRGGDGIDSLSGLGGRDELYGENGDDTLTLSQSDTALTAGSIADGGDGFDAYQLGIGSSSDHTVDFRNVTLLSLEELLFVTDQAGFEGDRGVIFSAEQFTDTGFTQISGFRTTGDVFGVEIVFNMATTLDLSGLTFNGFDTDLGDQILVTGNTDAQIITGSSLNDLIEASGGDDVLNGGDGFDTIDAGAGDDTILLGDGDGIDSVNGGTGTDTFDASAETTRNLRLDLADGTQEYDEDGQETSLISIDNVIGGGGDDSIRGDSFNNVLEGGGGNDTIMGGGSSDTLDGGDGNDMLYGGTGVDTVNGGNGDDTIFVVDGEFTDNVDGGVGFDTLDLSDLIGSSQAATIDLAAGTWVGLAGTTTIASIERVIGTQDDDTITGSVADETFEGGNGDDILDGGAGDDTAVYVGGFDDFAFADNNNGTVEVTDLFGPEGADTLTNIDTIIFDDVTLSVFQGTSTNNALNAVNSGESLLFGASGDDVLAGSSGGDVLLGGIGDDLLIGRAGADRLDGGAGIDTASYAFSASGVTVNLETGLGQGGDATGDALSSIENLTGSIHDDVLTGSSYSDNVLDGGNGDDMLNGEDGDDTLIGGLGNDTLDGGLGTDTVDGSARTEDWVVNLNSGVALITGVESNSLSSIENFISGSGDDTLFGSAEDNVLTGNAGDDLLAGLDGIDMLNGGLGEDSLSGGNGNDILNGGDGDDRLFGNNDDDVIMGGDGNDFTNGGNGDDDIFGGDGDDTVLVGGAGDDEIHGEEGNDALNGSAGDDELFGENGNDNLFGGDGEDTLNGGAGNDTLGGLGDDDVIIGGAGDDGINGGGGVDRLFGFAGEDTIFGGTGDDIINGGTGNDLLVGQSGVDRFVFTNDWGNDRIAGYGDVASGAPRVDETIDLSNLFDSNHNMVDFDDLTFTQMGSSTIITVDGHAGNSIEVLFRTVAEFTVDDFAFG